MTREGQAFGEIVQGENRFVRIRQGGRIEGVMPSVAGGQGKSALVCIGQGGSIAGVRPSVWFSVFWPVVRGRRRSCVSGRAAALRG